MKERDEDKKEGRKEKGRKDRYGEKVKDSKGEKERK